MERPARKRTSPLRVGSLSALFGAALAFASAPVSAEVRALVVGMDEYVAEANLYGAVNDANTIYEALTETGVDEVRLLLDGDATRQSIKTAFEEFTEQSKPGDWVIFTYAGHGAQEKERVAGSEEDGKDEVLILSGFDPDQSEGKYERIFDDDINQWLRRLSDKGVRALVAIDSCHSGTVFRSVDQRAGSQSYRLSSRYSLPDDPPPDLPPPEAGDKDGLDLPGVTYISAAADNEKVRELDINAYGKILKHGALSYQLGEAFRGAADTNSDGKLSRNELFQFVLSGVRLYTDSGQTPNFLPLEAPDIILFDTALSAPLPLPPERVRVAAIGQNANEANSVLQALGYVTLVGRDEAPDVIWDGGKREVISGNGDIVAYDIDTQSIGSVAGKWLALKQLRGSAVRNPLTISVIPDDSVHRSGERITVRIENMDHQNLIMFSLSGDGTVHYLYPQENERTRPERGQYSVELDVTPPFGADHLIAISSGERLPDLEARLQRLNRQKLAVRVPHLLSEYLHAKYQLGIQGLFTGP